MSSKRSIVLLTNFIPPYRLPVFRALAGMFGRFKVLGRNKTDDNHNRRIGCAGPIHVLGAEVAILTNVVAPYRIPIYERISGAFPTRIFIAGSESNRNYWQNVDPTVKLDVKRCLGLTFRSLRKGHMRNYGYRYLHITPGYLMDLVRTHPKLIISAELGFRTIAAIIYAQLWRRQVWVWWGGTRHTERNIGLLRNLVRRALAGFVDRWISYGANASEYLEHLHVDRADIIEIQNSVNEDLFLRSTDPMLVIHPRPVFLFVGELVGLKGLDLFVRAASVVQERGSEFAILIVGSGPEWNAIEKLVSRLRLKNVRFLGDVPTDQMPAVYRSADYLVFPTLDDIWGLVVNEAILCGLPTLCSVYAGCARELVPPENQFDPENSNEFVAILERAIEGRVMLPDITRLRTSRESAEKIIANIQDVIILSR